MTGMQRRRAGAAAALLALAVPLAHAQSMVSVARERINMRAGAGTQHEVLWMLSRGYPLKVIGRAGAWLRVSDFEGDKGFKPALIEIEDGALCPSFLIETHDDGRSTVFVPSVPTPMAGSILIIQSERVFPLDVPVTTMMQCISKWGSGSAVLLEAYRNGSSASANPPPALPPAPSSRSAAHNALNRSRRRWAMKHAGLTIFIVFFGISLLDALSSGNWLRALRRMPSSPPYSSIEMPR